MKTYGVAYVATGLILLAIDAIWLSFAAERLYRPELGGILLEQFRLAPAIIFYALYIAGTVRFAVRPALIACRWTTAAASGGFLGLFAYGTYDLTNQATLRAWPTIVTIADLSWGVILTAVAATAGYLATRALTRADWGD